LYQGCTIFLCIKSTSFLPPDPSLYIATPAGLIPTSLYLFRFDFQYILLLLSCENYNHERGGVLAHNFIYNMKVECYVFFVK
jgi:hypothetical protein